MFGLNEWEDWARFVCEIGPPAFTGFLEFRSNLTTLITGFVCRNEYKMIHGYNAVADIIPHKTSAA
jgi:hypothetical protein